MPFVSDPNLDPNEQNSGGSAPAAPAGQVSGDSSSVSGSTGSNSATDAPKAPSLASGDSVTSSGSGQGVTPGSQPSYNASAPTSSGQWTNLQNYLNANNGGKFGQEFSGKVGNDVSGAQAAVTNAAANFKTNVDSNTIQNNQGVIDQVGTAPDKMSDADQAAFKKQLNGSYAGPKSASSDSGFQNAGQQAQAAYGEAQQAQTSGGQQALLQKFYSQPNYTSGQQSLDSAILSADPTAQTAIQGVAAKASSLPVSYQQALTAGDSAASQAQAMTTAAQQAALASLYGQGGSAAAIKGGAFGGVLDGVDSRVKSLQNTVNTEMPLLQDALKTGGVGSRYGIGALSPQDQAILGNLGDVGQLWGVDPNSYLKSASTSDINRDTAATADEQRRMAALSQLAGINNSFLAHPELAGKYDSNNVLNFDNTGFHSAVQGAQNHYKPITDEVQSLQSELPGYNSERDLANAVLNGSTDQSNSFAVRDWVAAHGGPGDSNNVNDYLNWINGQIAQKEDTIGHDNATLPPGWDNFLNLPRIRGRR